MDPCTHLLRAIPPAPATATVEPPVTPAAPLAHPSPGIRHRRGIAPAVGRLIPWCV